MSATATLPGPKTRYTPEDLLRMTDEGIEFDLVEGQLIERKKTFLTCYTKGNILYTLQKCIRNTGWLVGSGVGFQCFPSGPNRVRRVDVAYHRLHRITREHFYSPGHCTVVPDLVAEVISRDELSYDVERKRQEWLDAEAQLVWVVHPEQKTIHSYRADGTTRLFQKSDILTAEPLLPEFRVNVADLFKLPTEGHS